MAHFNYLTIASIVSEKFQSILEKIPNADLLQMMEPAIQTGLGPHNPLNLFLDVTYYNDGAASMLENNCIGAVVLGLAHQEN